MNVYFEFNGIKSSDRNILLKGYKPILLPALYAEYEQVPGRHGSIEFSDDTRQDIIIEIDIDILGGSKQEVMANARAIEYWLSQKGRLSFWDEPQRFYVGRIVNQIPLERQVAWGAVTLLFRCEPFAYRIDSPDPESFVLDDTPICEQITAENATGIYQIEGPTIIHLENDGPYEVPPYIKLEGSFDNVAIGPLIINRELESGTLYIDNDKMLVYAKEFNSRINWLPYSSGDFIKLKHGTNSIQISGNNMDFTLMYLVIERW